MEYVGSFNAVKAGKAYIVEAENFAPNNRIMTFHVDSGASVTLLGLNSFCRRDKVHEYELLKKIIKEEIQQGGFAAVANSGATVTEEEIEMYPCKYDGVSIMGSKPITLYFHIFLGNIGMPLLGFDYIDGTSYHHSINGDLVFNAVAEDVGKMHYPNKVIDFNKVLNRFNSQK